MIIGISGKKQSGKDTLAKFLKLNYDAKLYAFADPLKQSICMDIFGLTYKQVYGTDDEKNALTKYKWDNLNLDIRKKYSSDNIFKSGFMTAREIMQIVGTDIFREMFYNDIWVDTTFRKIHKDIKLINNKNNIAVITDVRFVGEVERIIEENGYIIRLLRNVLNDNHSSETKLDNYNFEINKKQCKIIDNREMTIEEVNSVVSKFINNIIKKGE